MENLTENNDELLWKAQLDIFMRLLPVTTSLCLLVLIGITGNILTIIFYVRTSKRTTPVFLIICLAIADLATCVTAIPIISEMAINVRHFQVILCKLTHFCGLWAGACSGFILWIVAIDRYRKVCTPLGKQMSVTTVKYLVIGITSFSFLLSGRLLVTFDSVEVNVTVPNTNETAVGSYCAVREEPKYKLVGLVFYLIDFVLILMIWVTLVVTYSRIIYTIVRRRIAMGKGNVSIFSQRDRRVVGRKNMNDNCSVKEVETTNSREIDSKGSDSSEFDDPSFSEHRTEIPQVYTIDKTDDEQVKQQRSTRDRQLQKCAVNFTSAKTPSEMNLTLMMFAVSMIFILCFTPYFAIRIFIRTVLVTGKEYDFSAGIQFALKLPYLNSAFNPVIYWFFSPKFRRDIKKWFVKCCSCNYCNMTLYTMNNK